jgi:hypothetical protein
MYNSLRLPFAFDKRQAHFAADKMLTFFAVVKRRFYWGFCENVCFWRGVFVVKLWWFDGETW